MNRNLILEGYFLCVTDLNKHSLTIKKIVCYQTIYLIQVFELNGVFNFFFLVSNFNTDLAVLKYRKRLDGSIVL